MESEKTLVIDCETTGLCAEEDEIVQLSIIDQYGDVVYNSYLRPVHTDAWPEAERVNGISPEMVSDAPTAEEETPKIKSIFEKASKIIGYNVGFDMDFVSNWFGVDFAGKEIVDVMLDFAKIYGEWSDYFGSYKWQKLTTCARHYTYDWGSDTAHDSLADARATLYCHNAMQADLEEFYEEETLCKDRDYTNYDVYDEELTTVASFADRSMAEDYAEWASEKYGIKYKVAEPPFS